MPCFACARSTASRFSVGFATLSRAAAKATGARLRQFGAVATHAGWASRAAVCEGCPLRVVRGGVSYCGEPLLRRVRRDVAADGCGCPIADKAQSPGEHCPLDARNRPAARRGEVCNCKWCADRP